jgi:hypothetical protein
VLVHDVNGRLTYVLQHDLGYEANAGINVNFQVVDAMWYGINQYVFYHWTDTIDLGVRVEWFRDEDNARVLAIPLGFAVTGGNYVATTFGFNWRPCENVILRPELRWDWSDVDPPGRRATGMYDDFTKESQLTLGLDLILKL